MPHGQRLKEIPHAIGNTLAAKWGKLERYLTGAQRLSEIALDQTLAGLAPQVRALLLQNYAASGLGYRRGRDTLKGAKPALRDCVARAEVSITRRGVRIGLPPGLPKKLYVQASSLQHGAVYAPQAILPRLDVPTGRVLVWERRSMLGAQAKRTVKRVLLGGRGLTAREARFLGRKRVRMSRLEYERGPVNLNQIKIRKPRPFFHLTPAQVLQLTAQLRAGYQARMAAAAARRA